MDGSIKYIYREDISLVMANNIVLNVLTVLSHLKILQQPFEVRVVCTPIYRWKSEAWEGELTCSKFNSK